MCSSAPQRRQVWPWRKCCSVPTYSHGPHSCTTRDSTAPQRLHRRSCSHRLLATYANAVHVCSCLSVTSPQRSQIRTRTHRSSGYVQSPMCPTTRQYVRASRPTHRAYAVDPARQGRRLEAFGCAVLPLTAPLRVRGGSSGGRRGAGCSATNGRSRTNSLIAASERTRPSRRSAFPGAAATDAAVGARPPPRRSQPRSGSAAQA